jgi:hypothetical protein
VCSPIPWEKAESIGPLVLDLMVRKTGVETVLTHGFVGGIYGGMKKIRKLCEEYWVIQEKERNNNRFADTGDSGSSVILWKIQIIPSLPCPKSLIAFAIIPLRLRKNKYLIV